MLYGFFTHTHTHIHSEEVATKPLNSLMDQLDTGDIVLLSGATSSGAIIKLFDQSQFSHVGIVSSGACISKHGIKIRYFTSYKCIQRFQYCLLRVVHVTRLVSFSCIVCVVFYMYMLMLMHPVNDSYRF